MKQKILILFVIIITVDLTSPFVNKVPTLYEYYTHGGIKSGLDIRQSYLKLNNKFFTLYSGAMHYFRVPRKYWRDRLRKMRAAGLNAVETYIPWNLHEPEPGRFDFGNGGSDFQDFLNITEFFKIAQEEDLLAIARSGPYICSEWEFGGMPSWLLRTKNIKFRSSDPKFMNPVKRYFQKLIPILADLQFSKGGPIIIVQVENEYGSTNNLDDLYLRKLRKLLIENGIVELLVTVDNPVWGKINGWIPEMLYTVSVGANVKNILDIINKQFHYRIPCIVMELWIGWFDRLSENHTLKTSTESLRDQLEETLAYPASVNLYMFHGGTNFGFMNGATSAENDFKIYKPMTTSYDYDAPLTESGDYTAAYFTIIDVIKKYNQIITHTPKRPKDNLKTVYSKLLILQYKKFGSLLKNLTVTLSPILIPMELLPINNNAGQSYGYIVYEKKNVFIEKGSLLTIEGRVCDILMVLINGKLINKPLLSSKQFYEFGFWNKKDASLLIKKSYRNATLQLIVENAGRNNFGDLEMTFYQYKGIWQGNVLINNETLLNWFIYPLEFRTSWVKNLHNWEKFYSNKIDSYIGPNLYKTVLNISGHAKDTFIDMRGWNKGIVIVNGFNLGRYSTLGPQFHLYLPAPFLKKGENEILIFEHYKPLTHLKFSKTRIFINANK